MLKISSWTRAKSTVETAMLVCLESSATSASKWSKASRSRPARSISTWNVSLAKSAHPASQVRSFTIEIMLCTAPVVMTRNLPSSVPNAVNVCAHRDCVARTRSITRIASLAPSAPFRWPLFLWLQMLTEFSATAVCNRRFECNMACMCCSLPGQPQPNVNCAGLKLFQKWVILNIDIYRSELISVHIPSFYFFCTSYLSQLPQYYSLLISQSHAGIHYISP